MDVDRKPERRMSCRVWHALLSEMQNIFHIHIKAIHIKEKLIVILWKNDLTEQMECSILSMVRLN